MAQRDPSPNRKRKGQDDASRPVRRERAGTDAPSDADDSAGAPGDGPRADDAGAAAAPADEAPPRARRPDADEHTAEFLVAEILTDLDLASVRALVDEFGPEGDQVLVEALAAPPPEFLVERAFGRLLSAFGRRTFRDPAEQREFLLGLRRVAELQADLPLDGDADVSDDPAVFDEFLDDLGRRVLVSHALRRARLARSEGRRDEPSDDAPSDDAADDAPDDDAPPVDTIAPADADPYRPLDEIGPLDAAELGLRALAAFDQGDADTALMLAALALVFDARAIDAQLVAILVLADSSLDLVRRLERLLELGERVLGSEFVDAQQGHLGELLVARPWLRVRQALGQAYWHAGRRRESVECDGRTTRLDPSDVTGVRYDLVAHHLALGDAPGARSLIVRFAHERGAIFAWAAVLERLLDGDEPGARTALDDALRANRRALPYLAGRRRLPRGMPLDYEPGDAREAAACAHVLDPALEAHPALRRWLFEQDASPARDAKALARDDDTAVPLDPDRARGGHPVAAHAGLAGDGALVPSDAPPTPDEAKRLFTAAQAFRDLAPWRWTDDRQLLGVRDVERGEIDHACVVGRHGPPGGLVLYRGALGYACHARVSRGELDPADLALVQRALSVTFEERERLLPSDLNALARAGVRIRERGGWPVLRSWEPGLAPVEPSGAEARTLARALEQATLVLARGDSDDLPDGLVEVLGEHLRDELVRAPAGEPDGPPASWTESRVSWPAPVALPGDASPPLDTERVARLRESLGALDDTWSVDALPTSAVEGPFGTRAPHVRIVPWISEERECALDLCVAPSLEVGAALVEQALRLFEREGGWPRRLRVARPLVEAALAPLARALGLRLLRGDRLTLLDDLCLETGGVLDPEGD
ncbi:MAG: hypothetical protein H6825_01305 [Planctomycetes bacterium]|nr:hypothetical protein [Planctomycetota bacterium]